MSVTLHTALYKAFHAQKNSLRPGMAQMGLSPGQPKVLRYLAAHDSCMQKEIAEALDIEPATVSRLLTNMEQNGLAARAQPAERRRAESVRITEEGRRALAQWETLCRAVEEKALRDFTETERRQLIGFLCRAYRNLTGKSVE